MDPGSILSVERDALFHCSILCVLVCVCVVKKLQKWEDHDTSVKMGVFINGNKVIVEKQSNLYEKIHNKASITNQWSRGYSSES